LDTILPGFKWGDITPRLPSETILLGCNFLVSHMQVTFGDVTCG
jgi:hypothetical protein